MHIQTRKWGRDSLKLILALTVFVLSLSAQEARWVMVGSLHNFYQSYGSEPEEAFGSEQQWGLRWNAFYDHQDIQCARGFWIAAANYNDAVAGTKYDYKVAHAGPRAVAGGRSIEGTEMMPVPGKFALYGTSSVPSVYVDNEGASDLASNDIVDVTDETMTATRMLYIETNSSVGISMQRRVYAWDHPDYDNFHINDFTFTNTGIYDSKGDVNSQTLEGVYFNWQYRNAVNGEGTVETAAQADGYGRHGWGTPRDMRWGINTMNDAIGEDPNNPNLTSIYTADQTDPGTGVDVKDDDGNYMRAIVTWHGKHNVPAYDNIGSPNVDGWNPDGRLGSYEYTGVVTLHADKSATDATDDPMQPTGTPFIESNDPATISNDQYNAVRMTSEYQKFIASGHPVLGSQAEQVGTGFANVFATAGGYSSMISYGPYTLAPGESVHIVWAEAVDGLGRDYNDQQAVGDLREKIGQTWYKTAIDGQSQSDVLMPDGTTTTLSTEADADLYKDSWVYTSRDSLYKTFRKAIDLYKNKNMDLGSNMPPPPPSSFQVTSQGNRILLQWSNNAESAPGFVGYRIYRAMGEYQDSTYYLIADLNKIDASLANEFSDMTAIRGQNYFYYISSYDNGLAAGHVLESNPLYTRTNKAATLLKPPYKSLDDVRIVPNPFNIRNTNLNYIGTPYLIRFFNLPKICEINIYTERGDLVKHIHHEGSGDNSWDLLTDSRQIIVSGIYLVHFEVPEDVYDDDDPGRLLIKAGTTNIKKFIVIR